MSMDGKGEFGSYAPRLTSATGGGTGETGTELSPPPSLETSMYVAGTSPSRPSVVSTLTQPDPSSFSTTVTSSEPENREQCGESAKMCRQRQTW